MKPGIQIGLFLIIIWTIVLIFLNSNLYHSDSSRCDGNSPSLKTQLLDALKELESIRYHNNEMAKKLEDLRNRQFQLNELNEVHMDLNQNQIDLNDENVHSENYLRGEEFLKASMNTAVELWYYLSAQFNLILTSLGDFKNDDAKDLLKNLMEDSKQHHKFLLKQMQDMSDLNNQERLFYSQKLGNIVQKRITELQNPEDCSTTKKLICNLNKGCGFGCQLHHVVYCLIVAHGTGRTMILESKGWKYSPQKGWESYFRPLSSTCSSENYGAVKQWSGDDDQYPAITLTIIESLFPRSKFLPQSIPRDLAPILFKFHEHPFVWWVGQFAKYAMRFDSKLIADIDKLVKAWNFKSPIVGVHVRRTDKVGSEAAFHSLSEYMKYVAEYFDLRELKYGPIQRRVYLASDDPNVIDEAKEKYEDYIFISEKAFAKVSGMGSRYTDASLRAIILDIHFLSSCDHLVCTFSSQVCRVAYELMQTHLGDATRNFKSLDDIYYYGGQTHHQQVVVINHEAHSPEEIDLKVGDEIGVAGNHWNGMSKGTNRRTGRMGLYPSYKVKETIILTDFPGYVNVSKYFDQTRSGT